MSEHSQAPRGSPLTLQYAVRAALGVPCSLPSRAAAGRRLDRRRSASRAEGCVRARAVVGPQLRRLCQNIFSGGEGSVCFRLLHEAGFVVVPKGESAPSSNDPDAPEQGWRDGEFRLVPHRQRERAPGLAQAKKAQYRRLHGKLTCERCGLDPVATFDSIAGKACIEVHHAKVLLCDMQPDHLTSLDDLQCLCASCHRVVHRLLATG